MSSDPRIELLQRALGARPVVVTGLLETLDAKDPLRLALRKMHPRTQTAAGDEVCAECGWDASDPRLCPTLILLAEAVTPDA